MSVVIHEVSHGYAALYFGDETAKYMGRLTLNPFSHLDLFGSILLPGLLVLTHAPFLFGWAKPVPYNPDNLNNKKLGEVVVAGAGVVANFFLALLFGTVLRFTLGMNFSPSFYSIISVIIVVNLGLFIFNLVPIPPLDGSKILFSFLPSSFNKIIYFIENYSFVLLILFIVFFSDYLFPILSFFFQLVTGLAI
jgi:Zn-dependent protease